MDTKLKYQEIIKSILTETAEYRASIPDGYNFQVLFDDEHGRYLVLDPTFRTLNCHKVKKPLK
ncbi:element excision factor XisI family protein [Sphaerospermopsis sp. LEGE 08334]|uniref:element excision factor XisI family protein n=1 Tax=Sphaerospermopsis sp. LEGE 08334 TaxID=1828651 RepID=UPI001880E830|nr:element excision factor XisI family protein [Sphaerospermopsis sp. LEGE 08334]MBE9058571.1 XisI protein [Sphaerospermopsis sp. LEGE 08334]